MSGTSIKGSSEEIPSTEAVQFPNDCDILCGRGGLTNTHPGNAWYRNLVRANRPYYRSCPKHCKIMVAKSIVDHVFSQNPPCRFLEKAGEDNKWYPIDWKRSVDKTSQALRERERLDVAMREEDTAALAEQMILLKTSGAERVSTVDSPRLILLPQPDYAHSEVKRQLDKTFTLISEKACHEEPAKKRKAEVPIKSSKSKKISFAAIASEQSDTENHLLMTHAIAERGRRVDNNHTTRGPYAMEGVVAHNLALSWQNSVKRDLVSRKAPMTRVKRRFLPLSTSIKAPSTLAPAISAVLNSSVASPGVELLSYLKNSSSPTLFRHSSVPPRGTQSLSVSPATYIQAYESDVNARRNDAVSSQHDQFADPDDDEDPTNILFSAMSRASDQSDTVNPVTMVQGDSKDPTANVSCTTVTASVGALCRVCKMTRFNPLFVPERHSIDTDPELSWAHSRPKSWRAVGAVLDHCLKKHPHWPVWNTLSHIQHSFPSPPRGVNVFHRALAVAANVSPHRHGDSYGSSEEMNFRVAERIGVAKGYVQWGPWEFNNERALQVLASSMIRDYGTTLKMAISCNWDKISAMSHQDRVDLFNNIFLVPYCIDRLREKGELFPSVFHYFVEDEHTNGQHDTKSVGVNDGD